MNRISHEPSENSRKRIAVITLLFGVLILIFKFWAYNLTGSQAVFSDAVESIINVMTAVSLIITMIIAARPPDEDHPYGHGKVEFFSAAFEGGLITFASVVIVIEALQSFTREHRVENFDLGQTIVLFAAVLNFALGLYLYRSGKREDSLAMMASGKHLMSDFWTSLAVLGALFLVKWTNHFWIDPVMALAAAAYLGYSGVTILIKSTQGLMDAEDDKTLKRILKSFTKNWFPGIIRIHHLRVMRAGNFHHIDAHVVVPEFWDVKTSHEHTHFFEEKFFEDYDNPGELHLHIDPCRRAYCDVCDLKECPVRERPFTEKIPFTLEELKSPIEPKEYRP
ncbi:MAG: cation diffusion facilitator family transporter [Bdellovibrionales bacterium]